MQKFVRTRVNGAQIDPFVDIHILHVNMKLNRLIKIKSEDEWLLQKLRFSVEYRSFLSLLALRFLTNYFHWKTAMICILLNFHSIM